jgi:hypothetical protein
MGNYELGANDNEDVRSEVLEIASLGLPGMPSISGKRRLILVNATWSLDTHGGRHLYEARLEPLFKR